MSGYCSMYFIELNHNMVSSHTTLDAALEWLKNQSGHKEYTICEYRKYEIEKVAEYNFDKSGTLWRQHTHGGKYFRREKVK